MVTSSGDPHRSCGLTRAGVRSARMVPRSGERQRGCGVLWGCFKVVRVRYNGRRAS